MNDLEVWAWVWFAITWVLIIFGGKSTTVELWTIGCTIIFAVFTAADMVVKALTPAIT